MSFHYQPSYTDGIGWECHDKLTKVELTQWDWLKLLDLKRVLGQIDCVLLDLTCHVGICIMYIQVIDFIYTFVCLPIYLS